MSEAVELQKEESVVDNPEKMLASEFEKEKPEDVAAAFFRLQQPKLNIVLSKLSAKQLRRVIFNAVSYPFVDKEYKPRTDDEKTAAYLIGEMVLNRTIMQLSFEMQKADEAMNSNELTNTENVDTIKETKGDSNV